jgi:hypothetical protein
LAILNSSRLGVPIRVIRGNPDKGTPDDPGSGSYTKMAFVYDGLYRVSRGEGGGPERVQRGVRRVQRGSFCSNQDNGSYTKMCFIYDGLYRVSTGSGGGPEGVLGGVRRRYRGGSRGGHSRQCRPKELHQNVLHL